ncbi:F-box only protein 21 [Trichoplax sp. H2]|nr:F-box only protein 21 [Trichoplax sp. H2]|eukprot:RDD46505.1 F-box only protein 21 [Trichoplax sp. H2]
MGDEEDCHGDNQLNLIYLPDELIEAILIQPLLNHHDILCISAVCKYLHHVCLGSSLWQFKAKSRWSKWDKALENASTDWYQLFIARHKLELKIQQELNEINRRYYDDDLISSDAYRPIKTLLQKDKDNIANETLTEYLVTLLSDSSNDNLTLKYYGKNVYNKLCLLPRIKNMLKLPDDDILIEEGAFLFSSWLMACNITNEDNCNKQIDAIVKQVKQYLIDSNVSVRDSETGYLRDYYSCCNILSAINKVLYGDLGYDGNINSYRDLIAFIDLEARGFTTATPLMILRTDRTPIFFAALYSAIAQRLRVKLDPITFPNYIILRLQCFGSNGKLLTQREALTTLPGNLNASIKSLKPIKNREFLRAIARNLTNSCMNKYRNGKTYKVLTSYLQLVVLIYPEDEENHGVLSRIYLDYCVYDDEVVESAFEKARAGIFEINPRHLTCLNRLKDIKHIPAEPKVKYRSLESSATILFRIGTIVKHRSDGWTGVIHGWDYQQNLVEVEGQKSTCCHPEVGKYFQSFDGERYILNQELSIRYPDD